MAHTKRHKRLSESHKRAISRGRKSFLLNQQLRIISMLKEQGHDVFSMMQATGLPEARVKFLVKKLDSINLVATHPPSKTKTK